MKEKGQEIVVTNSVLISLASLPLRRQHAKLQQIAGAYAPEEHEHVAHEMV